jgi:transcription elongation factor Elf1
MSDGPLQEIAKECEALIADGATIWQKFTCLACNSRQTMSEPNVLYTSGKCQECGFVTDIAVTGCGFMLVTSNDAEAHEEFVDALSEQIKSSEPRGRN